MDPCHQLVSHLRTYQSSSKGEEQIKGWYFGLNEQLSVKVAMKDSELGGVYGAPKAEEAIRGKLCIHWQDGKRTIAALDSSVLTAFDQFVPIWRRSAYEDPQGAPIYKATQYPEVKLFDPQVDQWIHQGPQGFFQLLAAYREALQTRNIEKVDASVSASTFQQVICNSEGLLIENQATSFSTYVYGDARYGKTYLKRSMITNAEIEFMIDHTAEVVNLISEQKPIQGGNMKVLLTPSVAEALLHYYLLGNLGGKQVYHGKSAFGVEDFTEQRPVLREDMTLGLNTLVDYAQGSYISTYEGVPGGRLTLIAEGRLQSPMLDLKYGALMGMTPTPLAAGRGNLTFVAKEMLSWERLIQSMDEGIIVYDILGLHTQDITSGNYSLTAPNCVSVKDGVIQMGCKAVITGNFFEALRHPSTIVGIVPGEAFPCLLIDSKVIGEK